MKRVGLAAAIAVPVLIIVLAVILRIEKVDVTGNEWYSAKQIETMLFPDRLSYNSLYCLLTSWFGKKKTIPFVEDYKLTVTSPDSAEIIVYEKSIVGFVRYMDSCMYFDKDGIVVDSSPDRLSGVPEVKGLEFGSIVLYRPLPVTDNGIFDDILNLTQMLKMKNIDADTIEYDSGGRAVLAAGDITVELGGPENMSAKVGELSDILPELSGRKGTLYLDSCDPTATSPMYTFRQDQTDVKF